MARTIFSLLFLAYCVLRARSECKNDYTRCTYWADTGECEINPNLMMCYCSLACNTPSICRVNNTDTKCTCAISATAGHCEHGTAMDICPFTCGLRKNVSCGQPEQYPNAIATGNWTYMSRVTFTCRKGYINNGAVELRICNESGQWVKTNSVPDCIPDTNETSCQTLFSPFEFVKKNTVTGVSILHSSSDGSRLNCADWCLRFQGCTHFAFKNGICDIYYAVNMTIIKPRNGKVFKKMYNL